MVAFADLLDLQTAVIERVKTVGITDVFPQLVRLAESDFNRRLRCAEQVTTAFSPRARQSAMCRRMAMSHGARSPSVSGSPALILATFAGG